MSQVDLKVSVGPMSWPTPIGLASGACGYGRDLERGGDVDWTAVGAIFTKGLSLEPRRGNPPEWLGGVAGRMTEVVDGAVNAIGLENVGVEAFIREKMPWLRAWRERSGGCVVANVFGETVEEYERLAERLSDDVGLDGIELNLSCPNVSRGGIEFCQDEKACERVTRAVRRATDLPVIVKLSPRCDLPSIVGAAEKAGADALSISNTWPALVTDLATRRGARGGLSGPALRPIALALTAEAAQLTRLPIIGVGGIMNADDAISYLLVGASAVQIGTALFADPNAAASVRDGITSYLNGHGEERVCEIVGQIGRDND